MGSRPFLSSIRRFGLDPHRWRRAPWTAGSYSTDLILQDWISCHGQRIRSGESLFLSQRLRLWCAFLFVCLFVFFWFQMIIGRLFESWGRGLACFYWNRLWRTVGKSKIRFCLGAMLLKILGFLVLDKRFFRSRKSTLEKKSASILGEGKKKQKRFI